MSIGASGVGRSRFGRLPRQEESITTVQELRPRWGKPMSGIVSLIVFTLLWNEWLFHKWTLHTHDHQ